MFMPHAHGLAVSASARRLQELLADRAKPGADVPAIDQRIWNLFGERWVVMFTDLSGFSRRVAEFGIIHFLAVIDESLRLFSPVIADHDGILLKTEADSLLVIFRQPDSALACARAMQTVTHHANAHRRPEDQVHLCIGLGYGDVLRIGDDDVFGAQVNAASKLGEDLAESGEILVTEEFRAACTTPAGAIFQAHPGQAPGTSGAWAVLSGPG